MTPTKPNVSTPNQQMIDAEYEYSLARALLGGTKAMREAGEKYLPRWPNEAQPDYDKRRLSAVLFPAYKRSVQTLAAKPFSKPITVGDDVPAAIAAFLPNIDLEGRNLDTFAAGVMEDLLGYGFAGILVDYPDASSVPATSPDGRRTLADERSAGLRPYWVHIRPWQVLGWRAERVRGEWVLTQLRIKEMVEEQDGEFAVREVEQIRVLTPGSWAVYRQVKDKQSEWGVHSEGVTTLGQIPFVPCYGKRMGFMVSSPPLIEVAHLNVAHWQSASDQQTLLHVARVPILTVTGVTDGVGPSGEAIPWQFTVGASAAVKLPLSADMKFVEHSGAAIESGSKDLDTLEERMRQAGAELLVLAPGKVTATQISTENAVGMCALQRITLSLQDELNTALQFTADWIGEAQGGTVALYRDFGAATLQEASAELLLKAAQSGQLSGQTWLEEMQRRGIVSAEVEFEDEQERIGAQGPALGVMASPAMAGASGSDES